jgi:hypothetical protein
MLHPLVFALALGAPTAVTDSVRADTDIRQVALRHATEIRACYESRGLRLNPSLTGTLEVELTVLPTGRVGDVAVSSSDLRGPGKIEVEDCVTTVVRNWRFERGAFDTERIVYPFSLVRDQGGVVVAGLRI